MSATATQGVDWDESAWSGSSQDMDIDRAYDHTLEQCPEGEEGDCGEDAGERTPSGRSEYYQNDRVRRAVMLLELTESLASVCTDVAPADK